MHTGSSFEKRTAKIGHARKVWRSIAAVFPAGGKITNFADFVSAGAVPCGSPVHFDDETKEITVITDAQITAADTADKIAALKINGYLQEQVDVNSDTYYASGTVVYDGEIYKYMFKKAIVEKLEYLATTPKITWVN